MDHRSGSPQHRDTPPQDRPARPDRASRGRGTRGAGTNKKKNKEQPWYIEIPLVMVITLVVVALLQTFVGRLYVIPSQSMEPTLHGCAGCTGDRIFVDKMVYDFTDPKPGDVLVFRGPPSWNEHYESRRSSNPVLRGLANLGSYVGLVAPDENDLVKRVIAVGGQTVQCREGDPGVLVDGQPVDSSFILDPPAYMTNPEIGSQACGGPYFGPLKVPENNLFMMGDNRTNSADSRYHLGDQYQGTVPVDNVVGKVRVIVLPFGRMGIIDDPDIQHTPAGR
ncbi:signal peptidase I [Corynebacterium mendelii]|uniref:signal peptidase I n=1 Tax=Corynebacterium mendelii TaxID=2765362 RepID=UPI001F5D8EC7|nr:signal peptidase I [Corynebacterium mendelii]